jgi:hypothetical protein
MEKEVDFAEVVGFCRWCLDIAYLLDTNIEKDFYKIGCITVGNRMLSRYLRSGVKAVIDLQEGYQNQKYKVVEAEKSEESARNFLGDIFGDKSIDYINDRDKQRIKDFVLGIYMECVKKEV